VQPGYGHWSLSAAAESPSSLLPLSVISDLTLAGLVRSDSRSELALLLVTIPPLRSDGRDIMSSSVSGCKGEDIFGEGWTSLDGSCDELVVVELSCLLLRGVNIMVWDTGRFSGVELSNERRV